ncbi:RrF2 family transcriptional regulator [Clostridium sp. ZS2-4]|uniref:RrF2 family transcriptional regulator n=1 Tax=Clostridium sp. ZS2-4 TaxID=2987703 RepID=UPI00227CB719|nr:Rrf2 family transcriptional regulator [Clostridium sp. ZS2-4]MCY6355653.1 Rrf2 family transcriptional regulator [Clostridium sp. ZS2-4]
MKITQEVDYALRVVLYLSKLGYGNKIEAKVISHQENIPLRFLLKLLRKLKQASIIDSFRGVTGGYALAKLPKDITLKDVVEAIDGPIYVNRCLYDPSLCNLNRTNHCEMHKTLNRVQQKLLYELEDINFEDIIKDNK